MRKISAYKNNSGFSLVELIVIIAIITIVSAGSILSLSMLTGADARKAFEKIEAELNEAKTGSMSRYDEDMTVKYLSKGDPLNGDD